MKTGQDTEPFLYGGTVYTPVRTETLLATLEALKNVGRYDPDIATVIGRLSTYLPTGETA